MKVTPQFRLARKEAKSVVKNSIRFCDVCEEEIPKGKKYSVRSMSVAAAAIFFDVDDPDLVPTWTKTPMEQFASISVPTCCLSMGDSNQRHQPH